MKKLEKTLIAGMILGTSMTISGAVITEKNNLEKEHPISYIGAAMVCLSAGGHVIGQFKDMDDIVKKNSEYNLEN
tara:strand:+ start:373 stop:597 length:225 start_codon:yes stop_codon:yes gene_type:complete